MELPKYSTTVIFAFSIYHMLTSKSFKNVFKISKYSTWESNHWIDNLIVTNPTSDTKCNDQAARPYIDGYFHSFIIM